MQLIKWIKYKLNWSKQYSKKLKYVKDWKELIEK